VFDDVDGAGRGHGRHPLTLDIPTLRAGVRAVEEGHLAVGWAAKDFDDNSVLCRMAGQLGAPLGQFLGGGALLARVDERTPFFPSIYNEDWLFMLALLERRIAGSGQVLDAGDVHQDAYAPYAHTRAVGEELGDVLGEGMLSLLLQTDDRRKPLDSAFWRGELRSRRRFKDEIRRRVTADDHPSRTEMLAALSAVDDLHAGLERDEDTWVDRFVAYVEAWGRDREAWARRLRLDDVPSAAQLLESAEFAGVAPLGASSSISEFVRRSAPPPVRTAGRVAARL
jgi:hypothetical protein